MRLKNKFTLLFHSPHTSLNVLYSSVEGRMAVFKYYVDKGWGKMSEVISRHLLEGGDHSLAVALDNRLAVGPILCSAASCVNNEADNRLKNRKTNAEKYVGKAVIYSNDRAAQADRLHKAELHIYLAPFSEAPRHCANKKELHRVQYLRFLHVLM